ISDQGFVRMVRPHHDGLNLGRLWINQVPGLAGIGAPPESSCLRVHDLGIEGIKYEEPHHTAQVEHSPRLATVMGNVRSCHVAGDQHRIWIMWADGWIEHRATAAWA